MLGAGVGAALVLLLAGRGASPLTLILAITIALRAESFEDTIRQSALLGGDTDTLACIAGAIAEAIHGIPEGLAHEARQRLSPDLLTIVEQFDTEISSRGTINSN